ncbi:MAG: hypothetical protein AAFW75_05160 [Cyanobacteria bacterium J06636_16]
MKAFFHKFGRRMMQTTLAAATCALLIFTAASPAVAFGSSSSSPAKGTAEMNEIQATSKQAVKGEPRDLNEVQSKAAEGTNAVQGKASMEKMNAPEGSAPEATSVREQIVDTFDRMTSDR